MRFKKRGYHSSRDIEETNLMLTDCQRMATGLTKGGKLRFQQVSVCVDEVPLQVIFS
jgi:hypothetical protein